MGGGGEGCCDARQHAPTPTPNHCTHRVPSLGPPRSVSQPGGVTTQRGLLRAGGGDERPQGIPRGVRRERAHAQIRACVHRPSAHRPTALSSAPLAAACCAQSPLLSARRSRPRLPPCRVTCVAEARAGVSARPTKPWGPLTSSDGAATACVACNQPRRPSVPQFPAAACRGHAPLCLRVHGLVDAERCPLLLLSPPRLSLCLRVLSLRAVAICSSLCLRVQGA
jgi:hypothetical protein